MQKIRRCLRPNDCIHVIDPVGQPPPKPIGKNLRQGFGQQQVGSHRLMGWAESLLHHPALTIATELINHYPIRLK